jgi:type IV pilus assembly protein PilP
MKKYHVLIRNLVCLICLTTFLWGCEQSAEPPPKPKVVRKKIIAKPTTTETQPKTTIVSPAKPKEAPAETPAPKPESGGSTIIAKSDQAPETPMPEPKAEPTKKPAIAPKSEISVTKQPAADQRPQADAGAESSQQQMAAKPPVVAPGQPPIYNPKGKIDPFEPLFKEKSVVSQVKKKKRKKRVPRTPLERIALDQLTLVAIVLAKSGNRAMVEEASGKGYIITKGTYIGTNAGKVLKIERDKVIVAEEFEDISGNVSVRNTELKLPKPPGEL